MVQGPDAATGSLYPVDVLIVGLFVVAVVAIVVAGIVTIVSRRRRARAASSPRPMPTTAQAPSRRPLAGGATAWGLGPEPLLVGGTTGGDEEWARLEDLLLKADVGPAARRAMVKDVRDRYEDGADPEELLPRRDRRGSWARTARSACRRVAWGWSWSSA